MVASATLTHLCKISTTARLFFSKLDSEVVVRYLNGRKVIFWMIWLINHVILESVIYGMEISELYTCNSGPDVLI